MPKLDKHVCDFPELEKVCDEVLGSVLEEEVGFLAGSYVAQAIQGEGINPDSDLDVYSYTHISNPSSKLLPVHEILNRYPNVKIQTDPVIGDRYGKRYLWNDWNINVVHYLPGTPEEVINSFDFSICQAATDGHNIWVGENTVEDLTAKRLRINSISNASSGLRLAKYIGRGYTIEPEESKKLYELIRDVRLTTYKFPYMYSGQWAVKDCKCRTCASCKHSFDQGRGFYDFFDTYIQGVCDMELRKTWQQRADVYWQDINNRTANSFLAAGGRRRDGYRGQPLQRATSTAQNGEGEYTYG